MNFVEYKFRKAIFDLSRAHTTMMETSEAARENPDNASVPSHNAFKALGHTLDHMRYIADDLLSDLGNCWEAFLNEFLALKSVPTNGPKPDGSTGVLSLDWRLASLALLDGAAGSMLADAKSHLFDRLKDARNAYAHQDFWTHTFQSSFPSDSPFLVDLKWETRFGLIAVMRDARRGIHVLHALNEDLAAGHTFESPSDPCTDCIQDSWIAQGNLTNRLSEL